MTCANCAMSTIAVLILSILNRASWEFRGALDSGFVSCLAVFGTPNIWIAFLDAGSTTRVEGRALDRFAASRTTKKQRGRRLFAYIL